MRGDAKRATYLLVVALLTASVVVPYTVASPSDTETKRIAVGAAVPTPTAIRFVSVSLGLATV